MLPLLYLEGSFIGTSECAAAYGLRGFRVHGFEVQWQPPSPFIIFLPATTMFSFILYELMNNTYPLHCLA